MREGKGRAHPDADRLCRHRGATAAGAFLLLLLVGALAAVLLPPPPAAGADPAVFFREDFATLARWEPLTFPKIKAHSTYTLVKEGGKTVLKAESRASASGLVCRQTFNSYEYPRLRWRWKVTNLTDRGDPREKEGDDYPIRIYVMFQYDPARATLGEKLSYNAAKLIYGKHPPHSTLNYVWT